MSMNPLQLAFYKGVNGKFGAAQFKFQPPHFYVKGNTKLKNYDGKFIPETWKQENPGLTKDDLASREGALFLEITSATGPNKYDWDNKIILALSVHEMGLILLLLEGVLTGNEAAEGIEIRHDPGAKTSSAGTVTKKLFLKSPKGIKVGALLSAYQAEGDDSRTHMVPLNGSEVRTLAAAIRGVIPAAVAWS